MNKTYTKIQAQMVARFALNYLLSKMTDKFKLLFTPLLTGPIGAIIVMFLRPHIKALLDAGMINLNALARHIESNEERVEFYDMMDEMAQAKDPTKEEIEDMIKRAKLVVEKAFSAKDRIIIR